MIAGLAGAPAVAIGGVLFFVALIAAIGAQVLGSVNTSKKHLAQAAAFTTALPRTDALQPHDSGVPDPAGGDAPQLTAQLDQYYAANISQGYAIFWASLLAMVVGFAIILAAIALAGTNPATAIAAGVAGLLSQFIAATFLVALRSTQQQSTAYAQTLADLRVRDLRAAADARAIALGLQLLNEIAGDDSGALADQTRASLAMGLIVRDRDTLPPAATAPVPTVINVDDPQRNGARPDPRVRIPTVTSADSAPHK